ncbi:hypothetical protein BOSEA31B_20289 [Hyphomicrobiales bacterium]|nr:hypothetical protein BOSEA31B_20289 [Hyphomicrobiales bacterium]CAI0346538.1 hypothetical protein BO1005MUT1_520050 [Hyphomicrobiales bacterium]
MVAGLAPARAVDDGGRRQGQWLGDDRRNEQDRIARPPEGSLDLGFRNHHAGISALERGHRVGIDGHALEQVAPKGATDGPAVLQRLPGDLPAPGEAQVECSNDPTAQLGDVLVTTLDCLHEDLVHGQVDLAVSAQRREGCSNHGERFYLGRIATLAASHPLPYRKGPRSGRRRRTPPAKQGSKRLEQQLPLRGHAF